MSYKTRLGIFVLFFAFISIQCSNKKAEEVDGTTEETWKAYSNKLSYEEQEAGWELLFDGENADQWKGYNKDGFPDKGWKVEKGVLMVLYSGTEEDGYGGDLITKESYENFEFKVDFMLTDTANSGIFYRVVERENTPIWHNAPEYQLLDDSTYLDMGNVTKAQLTGANYDMHEPLGTFTNPVGEWNTARIVINNNKVEHYLNSNLVVEYEIGSEEWKALYENSKFSKYEGYGRNKKGHIGLQDHGHTVMFKNLKIKKL